MVTMTKEVRRAVLGHQGREELTAQDSPDAAGPGCGPRPRGRARPQPGRRHLPRRPHPRRPARRPVRRGRRGTGRRVARAARRTGRGPDGRRGRGGGRRGAAHRHGGRTARVATNSARRSGTRWCTTRAAGCTPCCRGTSRRCPVRLASVGHRLAAVPAYLDAARARLADMSGVHVETAIGQFDGTIRLVEDELPAAVERAGAGRARPERRRRGRAGRAARASAVAGRPGRRRRARPADRPRPVPREARAHPRHRATTRRPLLARAEAELDRLHRADRRAGRTASRAWPARTPAPCARSSTGSPPTRRPTPRSSSGAPRRSPRPRRSSASATW